MELTFAGSTAPFTFGCEAAHESQGAIPPARDFSGDLHKLARPLQDHAHLSEATIHVDVGTAHAREPCLYVA